MSNTEPRTLRDLGLRPAPPPELEDRVVAALAARHLIKPATRGAATMKMQYAVNAAVAVVSVVLGLLVGQQINAVPEPAMPEGHDEFVMLLYEDDSYRRPEPGKMEERIAEYSQWAREVAAAGNYVTGEKLTDDSMLLMPDGTRADAIPTAAQGALEGYFVITAKNLEEAASIAQSCPHLHYGGTVSLRRLAH
jgi:hypothetical protein